MSHGRAVDCLGSMVGNFGCATGKVGWVAGMRSMVGERVGGSRWVVVEEVVVEMIGRWGDVSMIVGDCEVGEPAGVGKVVGDEVGGEAGGEVDDDEVDEADGVHVGVNDH